MLPDAIIIGDSHSNALQAGCAAHGLQVEMLRLSGNFWHSGHVFFHGRHGVWVKGLAAVQAQILGIRDSWGGLSLVSPEVPVIATMGFHLGRLVPPFGIHRHVTDATAFASNPDAAYASQALVEATVEHYRGALIRMAQRMARNSPMVLVAPPRLYPGSSYDRFASVIVGKMRAVGVTVFDPSETLFAPDQGLPAEMAAEDGVHGNEAYGSAVVKLLMEQGLIKARAA